MECIYGWNNCRCCEEIDNPIYPCKWEEDNFMNIAENSNKHKRRIKHKRNFSSRAYIRNVDKAHKARLKFLAENIHMYPYPVIYTDKIWIKEYGYVDNPKPYYKRQYRGRGKHSASHYHKRMSNRKIRRYKGELPKKGNLGHRLYDFWWENILKMKRRNVMSLNKYDLYIGKSLFCSCGSNCEKTYEVVSDIYEKDGKEVFDIKDDNTDEIESVSVDFISEYIEY